MKSSESKHLRLGIFDKKKDRSEDSNKNFISFHAQWKIMWTELFFMSERNVISSKFHFGSHVNPL